jgi:hypothetical protein
MLEYLFDLIGEPSPDDLAAHTQRMLERREKRALARKRKRAEARKIKGLQYALKMRIRKSDRKIAFRHRETDTATSNTASWTDQEIMALHYGVLLDAMMVLRRMLQTGSQEGLAEVLLWMSSESEGPFAYKTCVRLAGQMDRDPKWTPPAMGQGDAAFEGVEPDDLREQVMGIVRKAACGVPSYLDRLIQGIKQAVQGDSSAMTWCMSSEDGPMTFLGCTAALGLDADECRGLVKVVSPMRDTSDLSKTATAA